MIYSIVTTAQLEQAGIRKGQMGSDILCQTAIVAKLTEGYIHKQIKTMFNLKTSLSFEKYENLVSYFFSLIKIFLKCRKFVGMNATVYR